MASDLISREAAFGKLKQIAKREWDKRFKPSNGFWTAMDAVGALDEIPAVDAVEVVRCKDCAHKRNEGPILRCPYSTVDLMPGGYCDKGLPNAMREGLQNIKEMEKKKRVF